MADYEMEKDVYELNFESARLAREACEEATAKEPTKPRFVMGTLGPTNRTGSISPVRMHCTRGRVPLETWPMWPTHVRRLVSVQGEKLSGERNRRNCGRFSALLARWHAWGVGKYPASQACRSLWHPVFPSKTVRCDFFAPLGSLKARQMQSWRDYGYV